MRRPAAFLLLTGLLAACASGGAADLHTVRRHDLPITVEATGSLRAVSNTTIRPPSISGVWRYQLAMIAEESSEVKQGQPIVAFDTSEMQQEMRRKIAERDQAAKELEKRQFDLSVQYLELDQNLAEARARLRRAGMKVEVPVELAKRVELEVARLDLAEAEAEVASLNGQRESAEQSGNSQLETLRRRNGRAARRVEELQVALGKMNILAPRDGLVIQVENWQGEKKKVGDTVSRWDTLLQIPDLSVMEAAAEIDEVDAGRVQVGQAVTVRLEAHPDEVYPGKVAVIEPTVRRQSRRSAVKVYRIVISLDRTDVQTMRPGMRFRAEIEVDRVTQALQIPLDAILPRPGGPVVLAHRGGDLQEVPVALGARNRTMVEVQKGLAEGDRVSRRAAASAGGAS